MTWWCTLCANPDEFTGMMLPRYCRACGQPTVWLNKRPVTARKVYVLSEHDRQLLKSILIDPE